MARIMVSGAGCRDVNGIYTHEGEEHCKLRFVHTSHAFKLVYDPSEGEVPPFWVIVSNKDDEDFLGLYHTGKNVDCDAHHPPLSGWEAYHAAPPAPTISKVASSTGKRLRDEDRECDVVKQRAANSDVGKTPKRIMQFYSKSKDIDDLGIGVKDWRKRLSNFWEIAIDIDGRWYPSVEHAFHAAKARCSDRPEMAAIFECGGSVGGDPLAAKKAGSKGSFSKAGATLDMARWEAERDEATLQALRARIRIDREFQAILQATAAQGVHLLHFDRQGRKAYWGGSIAPATGEIVGRNRLGEMLMELRAELTTD